MVSQRLINVESILQQEEILLKFYFSNQKLNKNFFVIKNLPKKSHKQDIISSIPSILLNQEGFDLLQNNNEIQSTQLSIDQFFLKNLKNCCSLK